MNKNVERRPIYMGIIMILVTLLVPFAYHLDLNPFGWNSFEAVLWRYVLPISSLFILDNAVHLFPYYVFGFIFVIQIVRHYQGKASRLWTLIVGLYAEIHPLLLSLPALLRLPFTIAPGGEVMYPVLIPIPALLLLGATLIYLRPQTRT
ncbi:MAG: hypothetical protein ACFFB7_02825 [Candidatus Sifarchaeia archaeon]